MVTAILYHDKNKKNTEEIKSWRSDGTNEGLQKNYSSFKALDSIRDNCYVIAKDSDFQNLVTFTIVLNVITKCSLSEGRSLPIHRLAHPFISLSPFSNFGREFHALLSRLKQTV